MEGWEELHGALPLTFLAVCGKTESGCIGLHQHEITLMLTGSMGGNPSQGTNFVTNVFIPIILEQYYYQSFRSKLFLMFENECNCSKGVQGHSLRGCEGKCLVAGPPSIGSSSGHIAHRRS